MARRPTIKEKKAAAKASIMERLGTGTLFTKTEEGDNAGRFPQWVQVEKRMEEEDMPY